MRPTPRALALVCLCALAVWLAGEFGARALNAVVVPALVALCAAVVQLSLTDRPRVNRSRPEAGFPGDARTVRIDIETDDPLTARITERVSDGLRADFTPVTRSLPTTVEYELELDRRGEHHLGPLTLTVRDVFGLVTREFQYPKRTPVLTYPSLYELTGTTSALGGPEEVTDERESFDELREYVRGDSLRDVHWKTSAKHDDLVVVEFDSVRDSTGLTIAAEATPGYADEMASATASIAAHLLDAGRAVTLILPDGRVERAGGEPQRERILSALARTESGSVETTETDIHVRADADGTHVTVEKHELPFSRLANQSTVATDGGIES
ncbi:MAG TPA: DUF58 domain-containing protein [Halococcus sp.]|nr:DUF58 domain-containing protein [Halococcus sp.]